MELEEEKLAGLQGLEGGPRRCPKVDLRQIPALAKVIEPVAIGHGDNQLDGHRAPWRCGPPHMAGDLVQPCRLCINARSDASPTGYGPDRQGHLRCCRSMRSSARVRHLPRPAWGRLQN